MSLGGGGSGLMTAGGGGVRPNESVIIFRDFLNKSSCFTCFSIDTSDFCVVLINITREMSAENEKIV